jgi:ATP-binding cassette, subfamily B, bacterial
MQIFWKYLKPHSKTISISLFLAGVAQLLNLVDPIIFGKIIDDYTTNIHRRPGAELIREVSFWLAVAIGVALLARLAKGVQEYTMRKTVASFGMQIFNDGLRQTLRLSFQEFEESRSGETLSVLQKVKTDTERFVNSFINVVFSSLVGITFLIYYSITRNGYLIPVFLIGILVLASLTGLLSRHIKKVQRSINRETNRMSGIMTESLRNIELVKSLGLTFSEIRRLGDMTKTIYDLEMQKVKKVSTLSFLQGTALNLLKQSILFILLWLIFHDRLSTGELITMQFISTAIFSPLQDLGNIIVQYKEVEVSLSNFDQLMQKQVEKRPENPVEIGPVRSIRFDNVVFRHRTGKDNAIDHLSFTAMLGDTIAFVGPSGSGKSTLLKLLVGLYKPVSGQIYFNEELTSNIPFNPLRRQMGFVTQDTHLFAGTIKDNLRFVKPDASDEELASTLQKASASTLISRASHGIDTLLGENGMKLSGGEKQRISIARALLRNPKILIFDEATSALDSITEEEITNTIRAISASREQITIMIAHRLSTIMHADIIYVLERGRITETGKHQQLLNQKGLYYAMWRQQIGERRE